MTTDETLYKSDENFMHIAIEQAKIAEENGDVPIGGISELRSDYRLFFPLLGG